MIGFVLGASYVGRSRSTIKVQSRTKLFFFSYMLLYVFLYSVSVCTCMCVFVCMELLTYGISIDCHRLLVQSRFNGHPLLDVMKGGLYA